MKKGIIFILGIALGVLIASAKDIVNVFQNQSGTDMVESEEKNFFEIEGFTVEYIGIDFEERPMLSDVRIRYYFEDEAIHFVVDFISDLACNVSVFNPPNGDVFLFVNDNVEKQATFSIELDQLKEVKICSFMFYYNQFYEEYGPDSVRYSVFLNEDFVEEILNNM